MGIIYAAVENPKGRCSNYILNVENTLATAKSTLHTVVKNFGVIKLMVICNAYVKWIQPPSQAGAMHSSTARGSEYKALVSLSVNPGYHLPLAEHAQPGNLPSHHLLQP